MTQVGEQTPPRGEQTPSRGGQTPSRGWRTPGLIVAAGCAVSLISFGVRSGFGVFLEPMSGDLGWGREIFALAIAIQNLLWGVCQPVAGAIADRYGSARVLSVGAVVYAIGLFLMAEVSSPAMLHLSAGLLIGMGVAGASFAIVLAAFGRMVPEERRSWALGIGTAAGSLGQFTVVPLGQAFLGAYGWSTALVLLGFMVLLVIPCSTVLAGKPGTATGRRQSFGEALREAAGHRGYWLLIAGFFVCGFHVAFIQTHLPAYIADAGLDPELGAWAIAVVGGANLVGAYTAGVMGGRRSKKAILSWLYFGRAVAIGGFMLLPMTPTVVLAFAFVIGLLWLSTVPLTSGLVAQFFGPRYMATLFGVVFFSHQVGAFLGVWMGGYVFDRAGSYDLVWWVGIGLGLFAALVHLPIDERPAARPAEAA